MSGTGTAAHTEAAPAGKHGTGRPGGRARFAPLAWPAGLALTAVALFTCYLRQSWTVSTGSDGASIALQGWDMLHGNLLLHGWSLADVTFYTTELPQYMLVESIRGLGPGVIHVCGALTYTLLVLLAALLARGRHRGGAGLARAVIAGTIMLAPQLGNGTGTLTLSPDHAGSAVPVLIVLLLIDRLKPRWYVPAAVGLVLAWALVADEVLLLTAVIPLAAACALQAWSRRATEREAAKYSLWLAAAAVIAVPVSLLATWLIKVSGGWVAAPVKAKPLAASMLPGNLRITGEGFLELYGADFAGLHGPLAVTFAVIHLTGLAAAALALLLAIRRFASMDLVTKTLVLAIGLNVVAYAATDQVVNVLSTREIAAVLPFGAVLAGRLLGARLAVGTAACAPPARGLPRRLLAAVAIPLAAYAAMLGYGATQPSAGSQYADLVAWLGAHHLHTGLTGYSQANIVTLGSHGTVRMGAVIRSGNTMRLRSWEVNKDWFDPAKHTANFVVLSTIGIYQVGRQQAVTMFGEPARTYKYRQYTIMVWHKNLLEGLVSP